MRVIIEIEGGGTGGPEVVLRSSQAPTQTTLTSAAADTVTGAIDAGPAPQGGATAPAEGPVTTPSMSPGFDQANSQSAGAAPGAPTEG